MRAAREMICGHASSPPSTLDSVAVRVELHAPEYEAEPAGSFQDMGKLNRLRGFWIGTLDITIFVNRGIALM